MWNVGSLSCSANKESDYYGQYSHRFSFNVSTIPNIDKMVLNRDYFIVPGVFYVGQNNINAIWNFKDLTNGVLHLAGDNAYNNMNIVIYYNKNFIG